MMQYRRLGKTDLMVSEIGLGGNNFGLWTDEQATIDIIHRALDIGINFIDTADVYGQTNSEKFVGKALKNKRSQVIVATKFGLSLAGKAAVRGGSRSYIVQAIEASLKRLQIDYIDLYQMHLPDPKTPIEETLRSLDDLVQAGKIRYIGCSNFAAWQLCEALWTSKVNHLGSFVTAQSRYNLLERQIEMELVPLCRAYGVDIIPWGPLAGGFLTGKYRPGEKPPSSSRFSSPSKAATLYEGIFHNANWIKLAKLEAFAFEREHTVGELAIAWLLAKPCVRTVITGIRNIQQLSGNVAAADWKLTPEEIVEIEILYRGDAPSSP